MRMLVPANRATSNEPSPAASQLEIAVGDAFLISDTLTKHGKDFGNLYAHCTFVTAEVTQCLATLDLPNGQITVQGVIRDTPDFTLAVTGGTGDYTGAGGTITVDESEGESAPSNITIRLR